MNTGDCKIQQCEIWTIDNLIVNVTKEFSSITGYDANDIIGRSSQEVASMLRSDVLLRVSEAGKMTDGFIFTKDLKPRHVNVGMYLKTDRETKVYFFERLEDTDFEKKFTAVDVLLEQNETGIAIIKHPEGTILRANSKYVRYCMGSECNVAQVLGKPYDCDGDIGIEEEDMAVMMEHIISNRKVFTGNIRLKGDAREQLMMDATLIPVVEGNKIKYVIAMLKDVKNACEQEIIEKARKANLLNKSNSDKLMKYINVPTIKFSFPDMEVLSIEMGGINDLFNHDGVESFKEAFEGGGMVRCIRDALQSPGYSCYLQEMVRTKSIVETGTKEIMIMDKLHALEFIFKPNLDTGNNVHEFSIYMINNDRGKANAAMKQTTQQQGNAEFLSYMAHEMKAPLTVIHSAIQLIDFFCHDELSERAERFINKIRQSSMQQLRLVNNFLDINKMDSGYLKLSRTNVDIVMMTAAIVNASSLISQRKNVAMIFDTQVSIRLVSIDDEKYERILLNILSNAIKFSPEGSSIHVRLYLDQGCVKVSIRDEGVGIPEDKRETIFEKFGQVGSSLTRQSEGTGLGLCLAKMLAKAHGGDITLDSKVGAGSEFTIVLPDIAAEEEPSKDILQKAQEDRLVQSVKVEFSNIYM